MKKINLILLALLILISACAATTNSNPIQNNNSPYTLVSAYQKIQKIHPLIEPAKVSLTDNIIETSNLTYVSHSKRELKLDIYHPNNQAASQNIKFPAVLLVHGGGWRSGNRSLLTPMAEKLANNGYVTVTVEYRLSPEAQYPAAVQDLKTAIRWLRANAAQYSIDTNRIAILGCSTGGQLAALVGMSSIEKFESSDGNGDFSSQVQAIINIDGLMDFTSQEALKYEDDPRKTPSSAGSWFGGRYHEKSELWKEASPLFYINSFTPPILFINSSVPRFHVGRDQAIEKLESEKIYYEVHTLAETPHSFWLFHPWFEPTAEYVLSFLNKTLSQ